MWSRPRAKATGSISHISQIGALYPGTGVPFGVTDIAPFSIWM